jgi:hypothetical protein
VSVPIVSRTSTSGPSPCTQQTNWYPFPVVTRQQTSGRRPPSLPRASDVFTCAPFVSHLRWRLERRAKRSACQGVQSLADRPRRSAEDRNDVRLQEVVLEAAGIIQTSRSALMRPCPSRRPCNNFSIINVAASDSPNASAMVAIASAIRPWRFSIAGVPGTSAAIQPDSSVDNKARRALSSMHTSRSSAILLPCAAASRSISRSFQITIR